MRLTSVVLTSWISSITSKISWIAGWPWSNHVCVCVWVCVCVCLCAIWCMGRKNKNKYWDFLSGNLDFGLEKSWKNHGTFFWDFCGNPDWWWKAASFPPTRSWEFLGLVTGSTMPFGNLEEPEPPLPSDWRSLVSLTLLLRWCWIRCCNLVLGLELHSGLWLRIGLELVPETILRPSPGTWQLPGRSSSVGVSGLFGAGQVQGRDMSQGPRRTCLQHSALGLNPFICSIASASNRAFSTYGSLRRSFTFGANGPNRSFPPMGSKKSLSLSLWDRFTWGGFRTWRLWHRCRLAYSSEVARVASCDIN